MAGSLAFAVSAPAPPRYNPGVKTRIHSSAWWMAAGIFGVVLVLFLLGETHAGFWLAICLTVFVLSLLFFAT